MGSVYPRKKVPLRDFGPEIGGGGLPQGGPIPLTLWRKSAVPNTHTVY